MRKVLACSLLILVCATVLTAQTEGWKRYKNAKGNFSVLFPTDPQDSENPNNDNLESHTLISKQSPAVYTVIYTVAPSDQKVDDATYQLFKQGVLKGLPNCAVDTEQQPSPAVSGFIGHWYKLSCSFNSNRVTI